MNALARNTVEGALRLTGAGTQLLLDTVGWRGLVRAGGVMGALLYSLGGERRRVMEAELVRLLGPEATPERVRDISRRSFDIYFKRMAENAFFGRLDRKILDGMVHPEGLDHIDKALGEGRGVILLLAHFGSFLLPLPFLGHRGYRVNQVAGRQVHGSGLGEVIWQWRKGEADRQPVRFIQVGTFLRPVYNALRNNEIVVIAFDGREGNNWIEADFLMRRALFSHGPFLLARKTGAAIIPTFMVRGRDDTHRLIFEPRFELSGGDDQEAALREDTRRFAAIFATYVRDFPCHFGMVLYKVKKEIQLGNTPLFVEAA